MVNHKGLWNIKLSQIEFCLCFITFLTRSTSGPRLFSAIIRFHIVTGPKQLNFTPFLYGFVHLNGVHCKVFPLLLCCTPDCQLAENNKIKKTDRILKQYQLPLLFSWIFLFLSHTSKTCSWLQVLTVRIAQLISQLMFIHLYLAV